MHVTKTITINRPIDEVYTFWRDFENLPRPGLPHMRIARIGRVADDSERRHAAVDIESLGSQHIKSSQIP